MTKKHLKSMSMFTSAAAVLVTFALAAMPLAAQNVTISGVDNSTLLVNQRVGVYLSVTDARGVPIPDLTREDFTVFERSPWTGERERPIVDFRRGINVTEGITMLLLVDNSGSMYYNADGSIREPENEAIRRISYAKEAVLSLLREIENPADRVGFASFNARIGTVVPPTGDKTQIEEAVASIAQPGEGQGFTELYEALYEAVDTARSASGRTVVILLSDGENYPLENNPAYANRRGLDGALNLAQEEGISIFSIGLSAGADVEELRMIAAATGGAFFSAYDPAELGRLYGLIRDQILNEYWLAFRGGMEPSELKTVRVVYGGAGAEAQRDYYSATMFGIPQDPFNWLILLVLIPALLLLWLLSQMKFRTSQDLPSLEVINVAGKRARQGITIAENKRAVTIGGGPSADLTIAGDSKLTQMEATITQQDGGFTVAGEDLKVNNRRVKSKRLKAGDVITVGETSVVFDEKTAATIASGGKTAGKASGKKPTAGSKRSGSAPRSARGKR